MNIAQIEENLKELLEDYSEEEFIYDLLLAYGLPKASITRLKKGSYDLSDEADENVVSWKKRVYYMIEQEEDLHTKLMELAGQVKNEQRFIVVTDFKTLLARDVKTKENLDIPLEDLPKHYDFFLPWAGREKTDYQNENPADVKAAERMAKLFDEIKKDNPNEDPEFIHGLNVFLSRLLFCFFAEDTNIFPENQFTNGVASHTQDDGSDLDEYLNGLFEVLNTRKNERTNIPAYLNEFPYVNGGLFKNKIESPEFTRRSRQAIINSGELDWSEINPDIFGSMMQAVITPEHRGGLGMHYTSVPNIKKVIKPLFLDELYEEFENAKGKPKKLKKLLHRIQNIKIFDPACGSGNFLIIAYKELRRLEMKIFKESGEMALSGVTLDQFYGIELDYFAHEIAQLSLWLAEHQMNVEFFKEFGRTNPTLPLKEAGKIVRGNACIIEWQSVCPKENSNETYLIGNPPYVGYSRQSTSQKKDMSIVFDSNSSYKALDYISCFFKKGAEFIKSTNNKLAFVSTNSITQGEQVSLLWPSIFKLNLEIFFAHKSFRWQNNAKSNATVTVVIIGLQEKSKRQKKLYYENKYRLVDYINPYLIPNSKVIVTKRYSQISNLPDMIKGCSPVDNGSLTLTESEKNSLLEENPKSSKFIKKYVGAQEFMYNEKRYCIWVEDDQIKEAFGINEFKRRFKEVEKYRLQSKKKATRKKADQPHQFIERKYKGTNSLLIPQTGSERREYLPIGFMDGSYVISNAARMVYDAEPWLFGILSSRMHMVWIKTVAGRLKTDMQYSNTVCYNTYPFPSISKQRKQEVNQCVFRILEEREKHSDKTLAELYDPEKMPVGLRGAHQANDEVIEKCYRSRPFESDEQRLEYLFKLYEEMIQAEKEKDSLFEKQK